MFGLARLSAGGLFNLGKVGYMFLSSFPRYLQALLYRRWGQVEKFHEAYRLLFGAAVKSLQATLLTGSPLLLGLHVLVFIGTWLIVGPAVAGELMIASGTILTALVALAIFAFICGLGVGVAILLYREASHYLQKILPESEDESSTSRSTGRTQTSRSSRSRTRIQSNNTSSKPSRKSPKSRHNTTAFTSNTTSGGSESINIDIPQGDIHDVEIDEYGQFR